MHRYQSEIVVAMRLLLLVAVLLCPATSRAQSSDEARNAVYLELAGSGGAFSVNYEREVVNGVLARVGFASWTNTSLFSDVERSITSVPVTIAAVVGRGHHRLEIGGGVTLGKRGNEVSPESSDGFVSLTGLVGYRYEKPGRGFLFRAGATPFYGFGDEDVAYPEKGFFPSFGVSFGFGF